ncbi:hypothetical protein AC1031_014406 [Aphanomyces cochlioides]|nr:hypothetical protein AC1031_014406 [Aphanomyces cochlioides]
MAPGAISQEKRLSERERMRKYRAAKRNEVKLLEAELRYLEEELGRLRASKATVNPPNHLVQEIVERNQRLRNHVEDQVRLCRYLSSWVSSQRLPTAITPKAPWIVSTLLADTATRQHGSQWLSEKAYYSALQACLMHPFDARQNEAYKFNLHKAYDDNGIETIAAMEIHSQFHIVFATLYSTMWQIRCGILSSRLHTPRLR